MGSDSLGFSFFSWLKKRCAAMTNAQKSWICSFPFMDPNDDRNEMWVLPLWKKQAMHFFVNFSTGKKSSRSPRPGSCVGGSCVCGRYLEI